MGLLLIGNTLVWDEVYELQNPGEIGPRAKILGVWRHFPVRFWLEETDGKGGLAGKAHILMEKLIFHKK